MLCFFAAKGGVGCSLVAAATALLSARAQATLLVDLAGDAASLLGLDAPDHDPGDERPGLAGWLAAENPMPDALHRIEVSAGDGLSLLPLGSRPFGPRPEQARRFADLIKSDTRRVVVDVGRRIQPNVAILDAADRSLLVTRSCYLALRAARQSPVGDGAVLVAEPGRALGADDVSAATGVPVVASIDWHPAVARAVDAGLLRCRLPRELDRLGGLL